MSINETTMTVVGRLTADPDMRFTPAGAAWARFTVANTPRAFDRASGEYKDGEPLFLTCTAWRELAEHAAESLHKGDRVIVVGRLRLSKWTDPTTGDPRSAYGLEVDALGPELRFATTVVTRTTTGRRFADEMPPDDEWESATRERPVAVAA